MPPVPRWQSNKLSEADNNFYQLNEIDTEAIK